MERYEYEKLDPPDFSLPENPIPKAEAALQDSKRTRSIDDIMNEIGGHFSESTFHSISPHLQTYEIPVVTRGRSLTVKDGKMTVWLKDLMHTRQALFDDVIIVPRKPGIFEIRVTAISEEMSTPIEFAIPLRITENDR